MDAIQRARQLINTILDAKAAVGVLNPERLKKIHTAMCNAEKCFSSRDSKGVQQAISYARHYAETADFVPLCRE